ncbi:MAG: imidazole glycerol phosphate synthase subunit HisH [Gammaproteobacteria bacterium]|nr:imidazole glycerol phosphate synthase subunit HisH [Gammaproteobacteria bacterium]MBP6481377.1 imidazole glycerol phosphate synthase subunit HisH [Pseudomonadales bacterium]MBP7911078.1 imidazole glycerol phosphate synthase subunit HisH [Pseudomonadales bacterium]
MQRVAVVDYGMGNLHSVAKALQHVAPGVEVLVTGDAAIIAGADRVVFPGVGAIRDCMGELTRRGLTGAIRRAADEKPLLAICIGMQALMQSSEENGGTACLGILPGRVHHFGASLADADGNTLKVPHMGWNQVHQEYHPLWTGIPQDSRFYFVHSYYVEPAQRELVAGGCEYGLGFAAALARGNLFAVQFHPEKSHTAGLQLLANFVAWNGRALECAC